MCTCKATRCIKPNQNKSPREVNNVPVQHGGQGPQASPATAACCSTAHVTKEMVVDQLLGMIRSALAGCAGDFCNTFVPCDYTFTTVYVSSIFQQHSICDTVAKCLHAFVVHDSKVFQELCKCVLRLSLFVHARVVFSHGPNRSHDLLFGRVATFADLPQIRECLPFL